jgi:hypothetical protein
MTSEYDARVTFTELVLSMKNRALAWRWARESLKSGFSVWKLEWVKAAVSFAERQLEALPPPSKKASSAQSRWRICVTILLGWLLAVLYVLRWRCGVAQTKLPKHALRIAAVHAEWSTRTRHLLNAFDTSDPPFDALILLGRLHCSPDQALELWKARCNSTRISTVPIVVPMSPKACFTALFDLPRLLKEGLASASFMPCAPPLRAQVAVAFRVFIGAVAARWWQEHRFQAIPDVYLAITGTADTSSLELAVQKDGGRTVHVLHGQATGPNFTGVSTLALFRSYHDAKAYTHLGCYGCCDMQPRHQPEVHRGAKGVLLFSNLAHPMNPGYRRRFLTDELELLACVGGAARRLGALAQPLLWKPHPVIEQLPKPLRSTLRRAAQREGFTEISSSEDALYIAAQCRWVLTSPSTVALDLLQSGQLSIVLDPQNSVLDSALSGLPQAPHTPIALAEFLETLDNDDSYIMTYDEAFSLIGPARDLDLSENVI